jgi:hypothetical protein
MAQDIAFRAEKSLVCQEGATWLLADGEQSLVCRPQRPDHLWFETWTVLDKQFPELARMWGRGRPISKPGRMDQRHQQFPREAERVLKQHPLVHECAVLGIGEDCIAFVELAPGAALDAFELMSHCQRHIGAFKTPQRIRAIDRLPRDSSGTIDYQKLEEMIKVA